jgi:PAS domain-containing protein
MFADRFASSHFNQAGFRLGLSAGGLIVTALPLTHSWPLFERDRQFELGSIVEGECDRLVAALSSVRPIAGIGRWECDLTDNRLSWSAAVYDLFGLPQGIPPLREAVLPLYAEESRALMERLRAYAIRHRRGFTLDAEIRPADGGQRWMRLVAAPIVEDGRVVRIHGLKRDVSGLPG